MMNESDSGGVPQSNSNKCTTQQKPKRYNVKDQLELIEDNFGIYIDDNGEHKCIKRFTWKNKSGVQVQLITYGARIVSIRTPDRGGVTDDILLGFDDLAGYVYHEDLKMGAVIGRVSNTVENGTFTIDGKQYWLSKNNNDHHTDGGFRGFDQALWEPYVRDNKVILSYTSPNKEEGYPGDLLVRISFELTKKSELTVDMEAFSTRATIIDLSHLLYFNLGGHGSGPDELYKHVVTINANCFTLTDKDDALPTGDIMNVVYSKFDYQSPKIMKDEISVSHNNGIDQNLCINRGVDQEVCFVARVLHPPSGRMLEIYSNQPGVQFSTANHFGRGIPLKPFDEECTRYSSSFEKLLELPAKLYMHMQKTKIMDRDMKFCELRDLIRKIKRTISIPPEIFSNDSSTSTSEVKVKRGLVLTSFQAHYLKEMRKVVEQVDSETDYSSLATILRILLDYSIIQEEEEEEEEDDDEEEEKEELEEKSDILSIFSESSSISFQREKDTYTSKSEKVPTVLSKSRKKRTVQDIPFFHKDGRIHGKNDAIYKTHGALSLKTQNYPNAIYHPNFPNCILRPGETYKHKIVYKFTIKAGNPRKWIKRNFRETNKL